MNLRNVRRRVHQRVRRMQADALSQIAEVQETFAQTMYETILGRTQETRH